MDGYAIWDTQEGKWWKNRSGKCLWKRKCDAGNAFNVTKYYSKEPLWSQQTRYVAVPVKLARTDDA